MIRVQPFSTQLLSTHRMFFVLDDLPKNAEEVDVWIQTPVGLESVDFVSVYTLHDGTLLAAWEHPFQKLPLHNLTVFCDGHQQILNVYPLERIIDIYDRPVDAVLGTFSFTKSVPVDGGDWRCDRGMYGAKAFNEENIDRVFSEVADITVYEPFLCINGTAHLIYVEAKNKTQLAEDKVNNSVVPSTGRTLQETLRLVYEWSILSEEPFNSTDDAATASRSFLNRLKFTVEELEILSSLPPMQISNYLSGSTTARVRPSNIQPLNAEVKNMVFKRMGSSSLSALLQIHEIEDIYGLVSLEKQELDAGISRFKDYYNIDDVSDYEKSMLQAIQAEPTSGPFVHNQLRFFANKKLILEKVENNAL